MPGSGSCTDLLLSADHHGIDRQARRPSRICADWDWLRSDADSLDRNPCHESLGESCSQHRPRDLRRRMGDPATVAVLAGPDCWRIVGGRSLPRDFWGVAGWPAGAKRMSNSPQVPADPTEIREPSLAEIALVFLKLGTIAFGGPAAHLAMMEEEFVRRRQWITQAEFMDRLATANLIPGPSSTEVAIFVGQLKGGSRGLIVAGCCFIIPAALIVSVIAWAYVRFGSLPRVEGVFSAVKPAVVAIIVQALGKMSQTAIRTIPLALIALLAAALSLWGVSPVLVLVFAGLLSAATLASKNRLLSVSVALPKVLTPSKIVASAVALAATAVAVPVSL